MSKIGIITDSTLDLTEEFLQNDEIEEVNLVVFVSDKMYEDGEIPDVKIAQYIKEGMSVSTSQPNPQSFVEAYNKLVAKGYDEIIVLTLSTKVSGTYNSARIAMEGYKDAKITVYNTKAIGMGSHQFVYRALEMARDGHSSEEIINTIDAEIMDRNVCFYIVDDLTALVGKGRLSAEEADLGNKARIKPILTTTKEGSLTVLERIRTSKLAINYCIDALDDIDINYSIEIGSINNDDKMEYMCKKIIEKFPDAKIVKHTGLSSITAAHFGIGLLTMSYMKK